MLALDRVGSGYGPIDILQNVSLEVARGSVVAVIGPNGAGKSTLLRTIAGDIKCRRGQVRLDGKDVTTVDPAKRVKMGLAHVPEGRQLFARLTVFENVSLGCYAKYRELGTKGRNRLFDFVWDLFPVLKERRDQVAGTLSGGEQEMLSIARGVMSQPQLLMLDEPSFGLAPLAIEAVYSALRRLNEEGMTILLVEQDVQRALALAHDGYLLAAGRVVLEGPASQLLASREVENVFLGHPGR